MDEITDCRKKIDELDRRLVELINERAECARRIGRLKRNTQLPIYEPEREKAIFEAQARESGKPAAVAEKMVAGRVEKLYKETVLLEQEFVNSHMRTGRRPRRGSSPAPAPG